MTDPRTRLAQIGAVVRDRFESEKRVLSFEEYLALFAGSPWRYSRDAARYLRDCLDWFGTYELDRPGGSVTRWRLFDLEFERVEASDTADLGTGHDFLVGQERLQRHFYRSSAISSARAAPTGSSSCTARTGARRAPSSAA
ncbi:MAG: hypothetical protein M5U28_09205 [Sandaracinaceae bacterium]|nr:hypothetical protein [Sandaracinaceae bacterium]